MNKSVANSALFIAISTLLLDMIVNNYKITMLVILALLEVIAYWLIKIYYKGDE